MTGERDELEQRKADLASQIEDFDRNRDARIKEGKASAAAAAKEAQKAQKALQKEEASAKKVEAQLDSARDELAAAKKRVDELTKQQDEQVIALAKVLSYAPHLATHLAPRFFLQFNCPIESWMLTESAARYLFVGC